MRTTNSTVLAILFTLLLGVAFGINGGELAARNTNSASSDPALYDGLRLSIHSEDNNITSTKPAEVKINLTNVSQNTIWVDSRLVLGYHISLYVLGKDGRVVRLVYPRRTLVLPKKSDFVRLEPGKSVARTLKISMDMLPEFARNSAYWTFIVKVSIFDSGSQFGIRGWTGNVKSQVQLRVAHSTDR